MKSELTIVIPAKNEANLIPKLLTSLVLQDYKPISHTTVYLADAYSTDRTRQIALSYSCRLNIEIIEGGLPAVGRNAGARRATTPYVLFLDADIELSDPTLVRRSVALMKERQLHCVTTNIACPSGGMRDQALYSFNNFMQQLSRLYKPFSTGMFMLFDTAAFHTLGGFHEQALFAEDYLLSQKVARNKFGILKGAVLTTNRRFMKMGYFKPACLFLNTALHTREERFFLKDHEYWHSEP